MAKELFFAFGMILIVAGFLVINSLPSFFTETQKLLAYLLTIAIGGVVIVVPLIKN